MAGIIYDTMDKEDITTMFDYTLDPMRLFNGIMAHYRNIEEKERQAKLVEARKKYVYGFKEVEFEKLFGKNVFDLDHGYVCYGYLTFKDKVISDYPIQLGKSIQGFLDRLNEDYNNGKKYRVQHVWQVFSVNNDDKKKSYVCEKCIENKKKKYINDIEYVLDIQAGEFVYKIGERSGIGTPYIYDNIIHFDHKYVHIPTGKTVIDASYLDHEVNATNIHDYSTINVDKYIIFSATKFKCSFHNRYEVAVKLDKITGEVTEIE
jgi:hypothetical protein